MSKSAALVTARTASSRLPGKCLAPIVGDICAIQVVLRRAAKVGCPVILATTDDPSDDALTAIALKDGIGCFRGAAKNKIRRWADCFQAHDLSEALLVDGDDPTFDFRVGRRALELLHHGADLVVSPPEMIPGFFTYGISRRGIEILSRLVPDREADIDVITEVLKRSELRPVPVPPLDEEIGAQDVRLTIDYPEDLDFYRQLYARIDYLAPAPEIVRTARAAGLQKINWHRQQDYINNQRRFNEQIKIGL
jgi:spore coat polysaccharide biosynthesis protein SpsF (cytidylyltransferase family)